MDEKSFDEGQKQMSHSKTEMDEQEADRLYERVFGPQRGPLTEEEERREQLARVPETLMRQVHGEGQPHWYNLYECEHLTEGSYPIDAVFPLGTHTNLIVCKHCYQGMVGFMAQSFLREALKLLTPAQIEKIIQTSIHSQDSDIPE